MFDTLKKEFISVDKRLYFATFCIFIFLFIFLNQQFLITDELYYNNLGEQLSFERINQLLSFNKKWSWLSYVIIPIIYLIKFSLISLCLNTGTLLAGHKISFKKLFQLALIAETIFLLPMIIKFLWFTFIQTDYNLSDLQYFYPLSILNFFEAEILDTWFIYPLQLLNLFEVMYWLILAYGLSLVLNEPLNKGLGLVLSSYGTGLVLWLLFITFLSVNFS